MDTRQLEYFVAVAEESSFTQAAKRLYAAQSTVSAGIRALERTLGVLLFDRSTARVGLTAAGTALLPEARRAIEGLDRLRNAVATDAADLRGRLVIGTFIALDAIELPRMLGEFHRRHPLVDLQLTASATGSTGLTEGVRQGRVDVAFTGLPPRGLADLRVLEVARSRFVALLPAQHPLSGQASITPADLEAERWVDAPPGYASRLVLERLLDASGVSRLVAAEVADAGEIPKLVAAGLGVAAIPEIIHRPATGAVAVQLALPGLDFVVSAITRLEPSAAAAAFIGLVAEAVAERGSTRVEGSDAMRRATGG